MANSVYGAVTGMQDAFLIDTPDHTLFYPSIQPENLNNLKTFVVPFDTYDNKIATIPYYGDYINDITIRMILPGSNTNTTNYNFTNPPSGTMTAYSSTNSLNSILSISPSNVNTTDINAFNTIVENINLVGSGPNFSIFLDMSNNMTIYGNVIQTFTTNAYFLSTLQKITCGYSHVALLDNNGTVWTTGDNTYGQLGNGTTVSQFLPVFSSATDVECCNYSTIVLSNSIVYTTGKNTTGELGQNSDSLTFTSLSGQNNVNSIKAGPDFLFIEKDNLYASGNNYYGQLGYYPLQNSINPKYINITGTTGNSTIQFVTQTSPPFSVRSNICIYGITSDYTPPAGFFRVQTCTTNSLTFYPAWPQYWEWSSGGYITAVSKNVINVNSAPYNIGQYIRLNHGLFPPNYYGFTIPPLPDGIFKVTDKDSASLTIDYTGDSWALLVGMDLYISSTTSNNFNLCTYSSSIKLPVSDIKAGSTFTTLASIQNVPVLSFTNSIVLNSVAYDSIGNFIVSSDITSNGNIYYNSNIFSAGNFYINDLVINQVYGGNVYIASSTGLYCLQYSSQVVNNIVSNVYDSITFDPINQVVYGSNVLSGTISIINPLENSSYLLYSGFIEPYGLTIDYNNQYLFIGSFNLITQINIKTGSSTVLLRNIKQPFSLSFSINNYLFVSDFSGTGSISRINLNDLTYTTFKVLNNTGSAAISTIANGNTVASPGVIADSYGFGDTLFYTQGTVIYQLLVDYSMWIAGNPNLYFGGNQPRIGPIFSLIHANVFNASSSGISSIHTNKYSNSICYVIQFISDTTGINVGLNFVTDIGKNIDDRIALNNLVANVYVNNTINPAPQEMPVVSIGNFFLCGSLFFGDSTNGIIGSLKYNTKTLIALPSIIDDYFVFSFPFDTFNESHEITYVTLVFDSIDVANFFGYDYSNVNKLLTNTYYTTLNSDIYSQYEFKSPLSLRESGFVQDVLTTSPHPSCKSIINSISLYIGKQLIQTLPIEFLTFKQEISTSYKNRPVLQLLEGSGTTLESSSRIYYIHTNLLKRIPIGAIQNQDIQLVLDYNYIQDMQMSLIVDYITFSNTNANHSHTLIVPSIITQYPIKGPCTKIFSSNTWTSLSFNGEVMLDSNSSNLMPFENFTNIPISGQGLVFNNPINFSRIRDITTIAPNSNVYYETLNILQVKDGLGGLLFS